MHGFSSKQWLRLSKVIRIFGFAGFFTVFLSLQILTGYYTLHRPKFRQPENGWTTHLQWSFSHPTYGTERDKKNQLLLFNLGFLFFTTGALGEAIRKLNEKNKPWARKL
jgi:hypothetical protein